MPIRTPEIASLFGALESSAFTDGTPMSAHLLRVMAMTRNRLVTKEQVLCNLIWPTFDTSEVNGGSFAGFAPLVWTRITVPIPIEKIPGHNRANFRISVLVSSGHTVQFQVVTRAITFRAGATASSVNVVEVTGTGSIQDIDLDDIPIDRRTRDYFELWVRGLPTGQDGATGTPYGTPDFGSINSGDLNRVIDPAAFWYYTGNPGGIASWAEGGHYVEILDVNTGTPVVAAREIIGVLDGRGVNSNDGTQLLVSRQFSPSEVDRMIGSDYQISKLPEWSIFQFMAYSVARAA